jgi:hypothetical protein
MVEIKTENFIERRDGVVFNKLDDELVMMCIENGEYYGLDSVGTRIWELIEKKSTVENIVEILCNEYHVDPKQCNVETISFLHTLLEKKLINII